MSEVKPTVTVDARGLACPGPLTNLIKAYRKANVGDVIEILATDPGFKPDLEAWAKRTGNEILSISEESGTIRALVRITSK